MRVDEFLAWEARQEFKWEFDGCRPVAMMGCTVAHGGLQRNLAISIGDGFGELLASSSAAT